MPARAFAEWIGRSTVPLLREAVARTAAVPGLSRAYRAVYEAQAVRATHAFERMEGVAQLLVRRRPGAKIAPGLSDVDLVVVLRDDLDLGVELELVRQGHTAISRINRGAPLLRDVHWVTETELGAWMALDEPLVAGLAGELRQSYLLQAHQRGWAARDERTTALRIATYLGMRAMDHLQRPWRVDRWLAARTLDRSAKWIEAVRSQAAGVQVQVSDGRWARREAGWYDVACWLRHLEQVVSVSNALGPIEERSPHPSISRALPIARHFCADARDWRAAVGAVLSVEGACEHDLRLLVVVDPDHPEAADTLGRIAARAAEVALPRVLFSRWPSPVVVGPALARRADLLQWTALEPIGRRRHGEVLFGEVPRSHTEERYLVRALARDVAHVGTRVRNLLGHPLDDRAGAKWVDALNGTLGAARTWLMDRTLATRYRKDAPEPRTLERLLYDGSSAEGRRRLYARTRRELDGLLVPLLDALAELDRGASEPSQDAPTGAGCGRDAGSPAADGVP